MEYVLDRFEQEVRAAIAAAGLVPDELVVLEEPKANVPADLAFPCFRAAKQLSLPPAELARRLAEALSFPPDSLVGSATAQGPFLNFTVNPQTFARMVLAEVQQHGERYGADDSGGKRTVIVEYSSPNVAKRMHVGHIRSTIIGQAINNILSFLGYNTIADNHLGDYGKQFGVLIAALERFGRAEGEGEEALAQIEAIYSQYSRMIGGSGETDDEPDVLDDAARAWSLRLEQGDPAAREVWQWMVDTTLRSNARSYDRLGIHFDTQHGESFYADMLPATMAKAEDEGVASREPGGALVVQGLTDSQGKELPSFLIQRSDGATLYLTRDVATIVYREHNFHPERIIYVVEQRQELHFRQVFALTRALGYARDIDLVHVHFGTIFSANGEPLSTRRGNMVYLQAMLDEAQARARRTIEQKISEGKTAFTPEQIDELAEMVGIGAIIYNDLYQDPRRNITLDWDRMLSFEGNSAPYLQYTYARCRSILREAGSVPNQIDATLLSSEEELAVLKQLARMPDAVRRAGTSYAPYHIADWLYTTAREFARFYREHSVLNAPTTDIRNARLWLVAATSQGLRNGLRLLGIKSPERM
jgi:arginyl-tRNA synthetase